MPCPSQASGFNVPNYVSSEAKGTLSVVFGVVLCDMYSNQELAEVHFMYSKADGNAALARRLYQESLGRPHRNAKRLFPQTSANHSAAALEILAVSKTFDAFNVSHPEIVMAFISVDNKFRGNIGFSGRNMSRGWIAVDGPEILSCPKRSKKFRTPMKRWQETVTDPRGSDT
ncbi:hypothetical protein ANN_12868 [Periplaneta americana]|uniref:DUF4817 domain-containing protein n=1 Tax=Periplaneta americana TaxID=6978 RepID=A0ABQ8TKH7_PERAM|nr:hypothetical protein ANN_12868 [Periplaneta americana]